MPLMHFLMHWLVADNGECIFSQVSSINSRGIMHCRKLIIYGSMSRMYSMYCSDADVSMTLMALGS